MDLNPSLLKIEVVPMNWTWVYKPSTEVKVTYIPTGFSVRCNATNSQHKNKLICLEYIKSYLKGANLCN